ncbi:MAG: hypothetical protein AAGA32_18230 [Pseudomonadota bacterium]
MVDHDPEDPPRLELGTKIDLWLALEPQNAEKATGSRLPGVS